MLLLGSSAAQRKDFGPAQVSSLIRPKHGEVSTWATVTETGRRGHIARILGGQDCLRFVLIDGVSPAKLHSLLTPKGLIIYFHTFPNFHFWGKLLSRKDFANLMETEYVGKETLWVETDIGDKRSKKYVYICAWIFPSQLKFFLWK